MPAAERESPLPSPLTPTPPPRHLAPLPGGRESFEFATRKKNLAEKIFAIGLGISHVSLLVAASLHRAGRSRNLPRTREREKEYSPVVKVFPNKNLIEKLYRRVSSPAAPRQLRAASAILKQR